MAEDQAALQTPAAGAGHLPAAAPDDAADREYPYASAHISLLLPDEVQLAMSEADRKPTGMAAVFSQSLLAIELDPKPDTFAIPSERQFVALLGIAVTLLVFNVTFCPIADQITGPTPTVLFLAALALGVFMSQPAALSAALVFGANPLWFRLAAHWVAAVILFGGWLLGMACADWHPTTDDLWLIFVGLPMVSLGVQAPLWIARLYFQWEVVNVALVEPARQTRSLSIGDIMLGTIAVALSFAVTRAGPVPPGSAAQNYWIGYGIAIAVAAGISTVSIPVLLNWTLRLKNIAWGAVAIFCYGAALSGLWIALALAIPVLRNAPWFFVPGMILGYFGATCVMFWLARYCGYRLQIGRGAA